MQINVRRALHCGAVASVGVVAFVTVSMPVTAIADNGVGGQTVHCSNQSAFAAADIDTDTETGSVGLTAKQDDQARDSRDSQHGYVRSHAYFNWYWWWFWYWYWHNYCAVQPPAVIPEVPQVLMLSTSAALTGGTALLIMRRRSRSSSRNLSTR